MSFLQLPSISKIILHSSAGFKSQEERQKEEIHKFWHCKCSPFPLYAVFMGSRIISLYICCILTYVLCPLVSLVFLLCLMCVCVCVHVCQVTLLSFKVESEYTFVDFIRGG